MPDESPYAAPSQHHSAVSAFAHHTPCWASPGPAAPAETPFRGSLSTPAGSPICEASGMLRRGLRAGTVYEGHILSLLDRHTIDHLCLAGEIYVLELESGARLTIAFTRILARTNLVFHAEFRSEDGMGDG